MNILTRVLAAFSRGTPGGNESSAPLAVGAALPAVSQLNQEGQTVRLAETGTGGRLLVYFYPKADTPGCTKQACSLRDSYQDLMEHGVSILGVSQDGVKAQKAFKEKHHLPFDLLADEDGVVLKAFGVPGMMGFAKRQAFLFQDGKLVWRDLSASTDRQAADVLACLAAENQTP